MKLWQITATFFYLGKLPIAPGSWGSLGALILWIIVPSSLYIQSLIIIILFYIGLLSSNKLSTQTGNPDPDEIVIDEVVGMSIALFMLPKNIAIYTIAFFIFRILDIFKPSFIYRVQKLPHGWGIMLDDVLAGVFSWLICQGLLMIL